MLPALATGVWVLAGSLVPLHPGLLLDCWEFLATRLCQAWNFFTAFWRLA